MVRVYSQKIIIVCPDHLQSKYGGAIADLFNSDGDLQLIVPTDKYARINEGEPSKYVDAFSQTSIALALRRVGFNITITDQRFELRLALEELAELSLSTGYGRYTPITVLDYARVEWQDYSQGYTRRIGKIEGIEDGSGGGGTKKAGYRKCDSTEVPDPKPSLYGGGFRFRFLEKDLRLSN